MADSTIPAAITALMSMFAAALPDVAVFDSDVTGAVPDEYVGVAFPDAEDPTTSPAVTFEQDWGGIGGAPLREEFEIRCEIATWSGGDTLAARRVRALALFASCQNAVRADHGLQSSISASGSARVSGGQMVTGDSPQGPLCTLNFTVQVSNVRI